MKRVNLWKTLFFSVLTVAAFTGCSKDDSEDDVIPSITVNGAQSTSVAVGLEGGTTKAVTIESSGDWTLTIAGEDDADVSACVASVSSGKKGTSTVTFTVAASATKRTYTATVTTFGSIMGQSYSPSATITIMQNANASTEVETNVKEIRNSLTFDGNAISASTVVTGIVVSDYVGNNINNHQIMITDNTKEPGAGMLIRFKGYVGSKDTDYNLQQGSIVSFDLKGGIAQRYNDIQYQVDFTTATDPTIEIVSQSGNMPDPITVTNVADLADYQSQYVQIYSQPVESIRGEAYYNVSSGYANHSFQTQDGSLITLSFMSYTSSWASTVMIPSKAGYIKGCVSFNVQSPTLSPSNANDLNAMTEDLFTVEVKTTTIDQITSEGEYEVSGAKVVGISTQGFVMQDKTGVFFVYFKENEPTIPALGNTVTVSGNVTTYGTNLQFADPKVTITDQGTDYDLPTPTEVTADNIESIVAGKPQYVKLTCELAKSGSYYNFTFLFSSNYTGSLCYPEASLADPYDKKTIDVEGWYVYTVSSKYFYVLANSIKENSNIASGSFTSQPATFEASNPQPQTLNFTANEAAGTVKFSITGTNADKFTYSDQTASSVTVKAVGNNETSSTYTADLNLLSAAGDILATVTLKQSGVSTGAGYTLIDNVADLTAGTYYMSGYSTEYKSGDNSVTFAPYSYHVWAGTVSGNNPASSNSDLVTVGYEFAKGNLTVDPSATGEAALITLEAVGGSANTYYIKSGDKYLKVFNDKNRRMGLADTSDGAEWTFDTHAKGGIKISNTFNSNVYILGTAGAQSNMLRSYGDPASSLVYGVCFFKAN